MTQNILYPGRTSIQDTLSPGDTEQLRRKTCLETWRGNPLASNGPPSVTLILKASIISFLGKVNNIKANSEPRNAHYRFQSSPTEKYKQDKAIPV